MLMEVSTRNSLRYDSVLCSGCGFCAMVCPHGVFELDGRLAKLVRADECMECGACQMNCPTGAIAVDSGVGCAAAMIKAALTGKEVSCGGDTGCCGTEAVSESVPAHDCGCGAAPSASQPPARERTTSSASCCGSQTSPARGNGCGCGATGETRAPEPVAAKEAEGCQCGGGGCCNN